MIRSEDGDPVASHRTEDRNRRHLHHGDRILEVLRHPERRFGVVSCTNCGFAELYKGGSTSDMIDLFLG
nr:zinc ribbon domain-containing protein [Halovivax gelatinilyticus]